MSFLVYFFVALVAALGVVFGLDVVQAPMSPMPASKYEIRAAVPPAPPAPVIARVEPRPEAPAPAVTPAKPVEAAPAPVGAAPSAVEQLAPIAVAEPAPVAKLAPRCDLDACAAAYRTFEPSDCTYKPSEGPRRLCLKGNPPPTAATTADATPAAPEARAQACNVAACSAAYPRSFDAADCTFRPALGPRRVCVK